MAQNMSFGEFKQYYMKQSSISDIVKSKTELEAIKIVLSIKSDTDEKDLKDWNRAMSMFNNKKIKLGGK